MFASARRTLGEDEVEPLVRLIVPEGFEVATRSFVLATALSVSAAQTALTVSLILLLGR